MRPRRRISGTVMLESALWIPILLTLMVGMVELARVSYIYFTLHKILYSAARVVGTYQGVNFCDDADAAIQSAKSFAVLGGPEGDATEPIVQGLTADLIQFRIERYNRDTDTLEQCDCSDIGCDAASGGGAPDFIVVSIPEGYPVRLIFPGLNLDPIPLRPQVRIPYGGT